MRKSVLLILCFLTTSLPLHADLDIYLSTEERTHHPEVWTSDIRESDTQILTRYRYAREDFPLSHRLSSQELRSQIFWLFDDKTLEERYEYYEALTAFNKDWFLDYISLALSPDIDADIELLSDLWITLTPFENVFLTCDIALWERRDIVRELIEDIYKENFTIVDDIVYSDIRFWDCIIPFPDSRRTASDISALSNTFESNRYIALTQLEDSFLRFWDWEWDVSILWISNDGFTYTQALTIDSQRIESEQNLQKSHGKNRIAYIHKNHYINPFRNARIDGAEVYGYNYLGTDNFWPSAFWPWHPLYISASASEEMRTILSWTELRPGIYKKIVLQQDSFDASGNPRQQVWASSYYAILYNHDITPPYCESTLFSHDSAWNDTFLPDEERWYNSYKYVFFVCWDPESWCRCDSTMEWCFVRDNWIYSSPQQLPHLWSVSYQFENRAEKTVNCHSSESQTLRYDFWSPDIILKDWDTEISWLTREYVNNEWVLYNGIQVTSKRFFSFREILEFQPGELNNISIDIEDIFIPDSNGWQSWLQDYNISVYRNIGTVWQELWELSSWDLGGSVTDSISLLEINNAISWVDIQNQIWRYQIIVHASDRAQNNLRAVWQYTIIPWNIDEWFSIVTVSDRWTVLADDVSSYEYQLSLRDSFSNPIPWVHITSIEQSCEDVSTECYEVKTDMSWDTPEGEEAFRITLLDWWISDQQWNIYLELRSVAPWEFTERFSITTSLWDTYMLLWENNFFLKPLTWTLETYHNDEWYDDRIFIWEEREYRLRLTTNWDIEDLTFVIVWNLEWRHSDTSFELSWDISHTSEGLEFQGIFDSSLWEFENHKNLLEFVDENWDSWVIVNYSLWWDIVRYKLSSSARNNTPISLGDTRELDAPLRLIWGLQGVWNHHNPHERQNFSDVATNLLRSEMRRDIHQFTRWLKSGDNSGNVYYIDMTHESNKNYIPDSEPSYSTLIVRNWNILINADFNTSWKSIWIISYMDNGYDIETWYSNVWNIYITPNVSRINAFIYADGWVMSVKNNNAELYASISERNEYLTQQLYIHGVIFTRNTIAWARDLWWTYMLPWSRETPHQELALHYDFYYLRRWNSWCETDAYWFCHIPQYLIIEHNTRIISSPPPLFSR